MAEDPHDLGRFVDAQAGDYDQALAEIKAGRKRSHWIWYVFPQIDGLGFSSMSRRYAIKSMDEAKAYLAHPVLGKRLVEICEAALAVEGEVGSRDLRLARRHEAEVLRDPFRRRVAPGFGVRPAARQVFRGRAGRQDAQADREQLIDLRFLGGHRGKRAIGQTPLPRTDPGVELRLRRSASSRGSSVPRFTAGYSARRTLTFPQIPDFPQGGAARRSVCCALVGGPLYAAADSYSGDRPPSLSARTRSSQVTGPSEGGYSFVPFR